MATSLRVTKKSAWKTVQIPQDMLSTQEFSSLVEIQELTDYELVPFEADLAGEIPPSLSNKRKRKRENLEETALVTFENTPPQLVKKKRKIKQPGNNGDAFGKDDKQTIQNKADTNNVVLDLGKTVKQKKLQTTGKRSLPKARKTDHTNMFIQCTDSIQADGNKTSELFDNSEDAGFASTYSADDHDLVKIPSKKRKKKKVLKSGENVVSSKNCVQEKGKKLKKKVLQDSLVTEKPGKASVDFKIGTVNNTGADVEEHVIKRQTEAKSDMPQWRNLYVPDILIQALQDQGFDTPTPIQSMALPSAIRDRRDILAAAETGSGKTLAFGIPVFARILNSTVSESTQPDDTDDNLDTNASQHPPQVLILEPTRELAVQVKKHLTDLARYTDIKLATIVGGMSIEKQRRILGKKPQVVIATPGRLWQLIEEGNEHLVQVDRVLCLVVDEADRMIEKGHYEELTKLLEMMNKSARRVKNRQTFVMSATLTMDVGAPKRVVNKMKKKKISDDKLKTLTERICISSKPKIIDLTPKDKVAQTLTELRVNCKAEEKDFYLYYFLCRHPGRTLVFANSKDCLRRLVSLFTLLQCSPLPLHADMQQRQRLKNLDKFAANSKGVLVASDVAARGLDIPHVDHVIHYQVPRTMENYVHRSGRTARASNLGLSVMLVGPEDVREYRKIVHGVRNGEELLLLPVDMDLFPAIKQRVALARTIDVKEYRMKKKRLKNNFFTKAAEEMDMILDDRNLLEDMGDVVEQAQDKQQLNQMRTQLTSLLRVPLMPQHMTKYPTKSGQLMSSKTVNLYSL